MQTVRSAQTLTAKLLNELVETTPNILVVGDLILDHYIRGATERVSPEAPVPVVRVESESVAPGGAANVMKNLARLGARVIAASAVGSDSAGTQLLELLQAESVCVEGVFSSGRTTPQKRRICARNQQIARFDLEDASAIEPDAEQAILRHVEKHIGGCDAVLLSDYAKGVLTESLIRAIIDLANAQSVPVLVDPAGMDPAKYRRATVITPNRKEAEDLSGMRITDERSLAACLSRLRELTAAEYVVVTLSEQGIAVQGDALTRIPAKAREIVDVTGAGDTVLACLGLCLASGAPAEEAAYLANVAAGIVVSKTGTADVSLSEILACVEPELSRVTGPVTGAREIEVIAGELRRERKRIVFTNGCFDLLHRGHVECLEASRAMGDVLIVAINSDSSVRRLKGADRPVVNESDRAYMLSALRCVDYVVVFDEDTPCNLIRRIRPHLLTKGQDYRVDQVVGHELVDEVAVVPFVNGHSTSTTIGQIRAGETNRPALSRAS